MFQLRKAGKREQALRAKRDLSKIYSVPYLDPTLSLTHSDDDSDAVIEVEQPELMTMPLFHYQRRAIAQMMRVERGVCVEIDRAKGIRTRPRGGVLCEAVGMVRHSATHSLTHSLCHSLTMPLTHYATHSLYHSLTH
jgi:hypothetical protein